MHAKSWSQSSRALGKRDESLRSSQSKPCGFSLSAIFLREEISASNLQVSSPMTTTAYLTSRRNTFAWELYAQALDVLSRRYPPVTADQSEPGFREPAGQPARRLFSRLLP